MYNTRVAECAWYNYATGERSFFENCFLGGVYYVPCINRKLDGVTVGDSGLCCRVPVVRVMSIVRALLIPFVDSPCLGNKNRKQRWLLAFKETNLNTQDVKNERFLIWTGKNNVGIFRQLLPSTKRRTDKQINTQLNVTFEVRRWKVSMPWKQT